MRFEEIVPAGEMAATILELVRRNRFRTSVHIRPTVYVDGNGGSGARGPVGTFVTAVPRGTPDRVRDGCTAQISSWERIGDRSMPARAKATANYNNARFAGIQASVDGYDAAIMLNGRGKVAEGQGMCLFLVRDGVAVTPSITSDILESITRGHGADAAEGHGHRHQRARCRSHRVLPRVGGVLLWYRVGDHADQRGRRRGPSVWDVRAR